MNVLIKLIGAVLVTLIIAGCSDKAANPAKEAAGGGDLVYEGVLPCADCEGIETRITLHEGDRYTLSSLYLGTDQAAVVERGTFTRHPQESRIVLDDGRQFKQGESSLLHLSMDGHIITSALSEHYVLKQVQ